MPHTSWLAADLFLLRYSAARWHVPASILPQAMQDCQRHIHLELAENISTFIKVLRWNQGVTGSQNPFAYVREPLSHELLREASDVASQNPRSGLIIGVSALETGLKDYLEFLVKDSKQILEKIQSPPAILILQEIIPALHEQRGIQSDFFPLKKNEKEFLQKWITQRNKVTHGVKRLVDGLKLHELLIFVRRLLYQIDHLKGYEWARRLAEDFYGPD